MKEESLIQGSIDPINMANTERILNQMKNCICKIKIENIKATGFFCKIPNINKNFLMTNYHVIDEIYINKNKEIPLLLNDNKTIFIIDLNKKREKYFNKEYDITLIEIKEDEKIRKYLELDDNLFNDNEKIYYRKKSIYILHYIFGKKICVSYGILQSIYNYDITHSCSTDKGSSGSPIINLENNKVIGIHTEGFANFNFNKGTILKYPLNDFIKKYNENKNNSSIDEININKNDTNKNDINKNDINKNDINNNDINKNIQILNIDSKNDDNNSLMSNSLIFINEFDLSFKKGFKDFGLHENSRLNSIIQMLTSIKEIYDFFSLYEYSEDYKIKKFKHIYALTSFFFRALEDVYKKGPINPSLREMNIVIKFLNENITNASTYDYILFILNQLHEELTSYEDNIPKSENLIFFGDSSNNINDSKNQFFTYYNTKYSKTIISDLFNWIQRENKTCNYCSTILYSFKALPLILFDLDSIFSYLYKSMQKNDNIRIDLETCFKIYFSFDNKINNIEEKCPICGHNSGFIYNITLVSSPKYFIIVINKTNYINLFYSEEFELPFEKDTQCLFKKYKLIGVIMEDLEQPNKCSYVVKNIEEKKDGKIIEDWISFKDENVNHISFEQSQSKFEKEKEVFDALNARILIYKGIKIENEFNMDID